MNYILYDDFIVRNNLLPLTFMRPVAEIRIGILTIREKWNRYLETETSTLTEDYLSKKYPVIKEPNNILINSSVCPNKKLVERIKELKPNQALICCDKLIAMYLKSEDLDMVGGRDSQNIEEIVVDSNPIVVNYLYDIFKKNGEAIKEDFDLITKNRKSQTISDSNKLIDGKDIFIEEGAKVECAYLNASNGPIYIGQDAEIMEGSMIRGPLALGEHSIIKMGAKIYGPTTIGKHSKVGGEVNNTVFFGYSNKAHDGFIGNSVISEWCNIGADTNNSNLKNTYDNIKLWNYPEKSFVDTNSVFCGLIMGDHSKTGINTMINTGTVIGVNCNIYGPGFPRNFIPSFSWGGTSGFSSYDLKKAFRVAENVYKRRNLEFDDVEKNILTHVYNETLGNSFL